MDIDGDIFPDIITNQWINNASIKWYENPFIGVGSERHTSSWIVQVFPNPVNDRLFFESPTEEPFSFEISTLNGQLILTNEMEETTQLDLSSFQKGIYVITIRSKDFVTSKKIVKL